MRKLSIFGFCGLFIALAFVTPTHDDAHATMFDSHEELRQEAGRVFGKAVSVVTSRVSDLGVSSDISPTVLVETAYDAVPKNTSDVIRLATSLVRPNSDAIDHGSALRELVSRETDSVVQKQLQRIEWAVQKNDPRLCEALTEVQGVTSPDLSDLLAFCLARTTGEAKRCDQINGEGTALLHAACIEGLASTCTILPK